MSIITKKLELKANIIKALSHPVRLYIIEKLEEGECCVCEFHDEVGGDFSMVSKHLTILKKAGVIESEKRGLKVFYKLKVPCINNFLSCIENIAIDNVKEVMEIL